MERTENLRNCNHRRIFDDIHVCRKIAQQHIMPCEMIGFLGNRKRSADRIFVRPHDSRSAENRILLQIAAEEEVVYIQRRAVKRSKSAKNDYCGSESPAETVKSSVYNSRPQTKPRAEKQRERIQHDTAHKQQISVNCRFSEIEVKSLHNRKVTLNENRADSGSKNAGCGKSCPHGVYAKSFGQKGEIALFRVLLRVLLDAAVFIAVFIIICGI